MSGNEDPDYLSKWLESSDPVENIHEKPFVILSYATSLDGSITAQQGKPTPISCRKSAEAVHRIRAYCDAILVGIGTVLSDNPRLSVRLAEGGNPVPVIIDTNLRTPVSSRLFDEGRNPLIFCASSPDKGRRAELEKKGAVVVESENEEMGLSLIYVLKYLNDLGIRFLMVEGGGRIIGSFLEQELWDKMAVTVSPLILGGYNLLGGRNVSSSVKFKSAQWYSSGSDQICLIERDLL